MHRWLTFTLAAALTLAALSCASAADTAAPAAAPTLRFADFFRQPTGPRGLEPSARLLAANRQRVTLVGYMVATEWPRAGRFLLTALPVRMSEHADGDADDLPPATVAVWLDASQQAQVLPHQGGLIALTGVLHYGRHEEPDGRVVWVGLQLDADAVKPATAKP